MATYRITEEYEVENKAIVFTVKGLPNWYDGKDEQFFVHPYDSYMRKLYNEYTGKYKSQLEFDAEYASKMMKRARGPVYITSHDVIALTKAYAVFSELYDITQSNDNVHSGDRFIYRSFEFILERAWIEGSPGGIKALDEEQEERVERGFSSTPNESNEQLKEAIWEDYSQD